MTAKHTPGPWDAPDIDDGCSACQYWIVGPDGEQLAAVVDDNGAPQANARLIAAAPDMLRALRQSVLALAHASEASPGLYAPAYEAVSAAIAKATGEDA